MNPLKSVVQTGIIILVATMVFAIGPAFANNWQWDLDQIKANQKRAEQRRANAQATLMLEKSAAERDKAEAEKAKPAATPQVK